MKRTAVAMMKANTPASKALNGRRPRVFWPGETGTEVVVVVAVVTPGVGVAEVVWTATELLLPEDDVDDRV
jgi:hypothetical protein